MIDSLSGQFSKGKAFFHLPGLFEFFNFYKKFLPIFREHREWFYSWCDIASVYGSPEDCLWAGGRIEESGLRCGDNELEQVRDLLNDFGISARLTFSNSLLRAEHLADEKCNLLCRIFGGDTGAGGGVCRVVKNGVILHSDLLLEYLKKNYPDFYFVSSTTKVLTDFSDFEAELDRADFSFVVPDFRLNKSFEKLGGLTQAQKDKVEFLCNECCWAGCKDRRECYESVSREVLERCAGGSPDGSVDAHICRAPGGNKGYRFSLAMKNPAFISLDDIQKVFLPMGFSNFKIEGRSLGSALLLEFILYYMTKPEFHINLREELYLDNLLDLF
ncbi:MAG: hypothetical protein IJ688_06930 [Treponema sp.]|nr:hypothetical protein [Treponema sp.]